MVKRRRTKVASAVSMALALASGHALAQDDADDAAMEEIVVTGKFRASLIDSIGTKRNSSSIVEAISAEDIGKLPDSSIAEAISRLPGLAGQRLDGRTSSIAIRGLGEDFSTATLNGREQVTISDNRGIEFDLYPSEIMSGVTVHKTPDATLMTQGIGGTINLHTVKPLNHDDTLQLNFTLEQNGHDKLNADGEDSGWRTTFTWIDRFADDTLGVALAIANMDSPNQEERWNSWGFPTAFEDCVTGAVVTNGTCSDGTTANDELGLINGGAKPFVRSSTLERRTYMGVLQFEPNDRLSITADALYIDFSDEKILRGIELPGAWSGGPLQATSVTNGFVDEGVWENVRGQIRNDFETREARLTSYGLNASYDLNDSWSVIGDISQGDVDRNIWSLESYSGAGRSSDPNVPDDDIGWSMNGSNEGARFFPSLDYSDTSMFQLGGAQGWGNGNTVPNDAQDGFINFPHVDDRLNTYRLSLEGGVELGVVTGLEFGVYLSQREKAKYDQGTFLTLPAYPGVQSIPDQYRVADTSLDFIGMGEMISYDSFAFWADGNYLETPEGLTSSNRAQNTWVVEEDVTILYAMADFDTELGSVGLTGNFGVQLVNTDQFSTGYAVDIVNGFVRAQPTSGGADFDEVLPSLNTIFHLTDEQQVRFGAARTMSRSRMDRMNAGFGFSYSPANLPSSGSYWAGSGSNPELKPQVANQFDLSYEWYYADDGYVALAYFYKDLQDWQINVGEEVDFSGLTPPPGQPPSPSDIGIVTRWENAEGGSVDGFEVQGALPGRFIADSLEGFGAVLSATFLNSSIESGGSSITVPGLSDTIYNMTLFYENQGFEARVNMSARDEFLGEVNAISFSRELVSVKETEIWDAQVSYDFAESGISALEGLSISLQGQNLTNEPFVTYNNNDPRQVRDFQNYGRNYLLSARYRF